MLTPLDIENKKFSKQMMNGYSVNEVDEFLDELTADYEKLYKETTDSKNKIADMQEEMAKYKNIESTLNIQNYMVSLDINVGLDPETGLYDNNTVKSELINKIIHLSKEETFV